MTAHTLRIFNSLTRKVEPFRPADCSRISFYTCGLTVYDFGHIGNFRSFLAADVLRRWIESPLCVIEGPGGEPHSGPRRVVHVMNITDVGHMTDDQAADGGGEDKMALAGQRLAESKKSGRIPGGADVDPADPYSVAAFFTRAFIEDATSLGLRAVIDAQRDPTLMPKATDSIGSMIRVIEKLIERGHAYIVGETGSRVVYFDVRSFPRYGMLSGNTLDQLKGGAGGRVQAENQAAKRHPADFLLWKEDSSHLMKWPSPWGEGYPGWHIECSAMAYDRLVEQERGRGVADAVFRKSDPLIDIHSGGEDNIFPHHECEIAQSCCAFNEDPGRSAMARLWFHPRFLMVDGEKMSKSKGNFYTFRDLLAKGHEAGAIRLELIRTHYRANANFTEQGLKDAARMLERWRRFRDEAEASSEQGERPEVLDRFAEVMHDDLNVSGAIGEINAWINRTENPTHADGAAMQRMDMVLGVLGLKRAEKTATEIGVFIGVEPDAEIESKLADRRDARKAKDFAKADAIRDELAQQGYQIKDVAGGKVEVRRG